MKMFATARLALAASPSEQEFITYGNAILAVNNYAYAITQTNLPILTHPPENYGQFTTLFEPAKQHCLNWTQSILVNMLQVPNTIIQASDLFTLEDSMATAYLDMLVTDPSSAQAKSGLAKALATMNSMVTGQIKIISAVQEQLETFATQIVEDAQALNTIAQKSLEAADDDQKSIAKLNDTIGNLNTQIATMNTWLTVSEIGIGVSLFVGLIGAVVCFIPGAQVVGGGIVVLGVIGELASIAGTVILSQLIQNAQQQIDFDRKEISQFHQDIILLQGVNTQFQTLIKLNAAATTALATVKAVWTNLSRAITTVQTDLATAGQDVTSAQYQTALSDMSRASGSWDKLVEFARNMQKVKIQWIDANGVVHDFSDTGTLVTPGGSQVTLISKSSAA